MARVYRAKNELTKAAQYYRSGKKRFDQTQVIEADPTWYANMLNEYLTILGKVDNNENLTNYRKQMTELRQHVGNYKKYALWTILYKV